MISIKPKIRTLLRTIGNGLQAENADGVIYTWRTPDVLKVGSQQTVRDPEMTKQKAYRNNHVTLYVVPSLLQQK